MNTEQKICQNCKQDFIIEPDDFNFYERMKVPPPTFCPQCRLIRRLHTLNQRFLYKRQCELCGKNTFSIYSTDKPFKVFCHTCWWSDKWEAMRYGRDYDFSKSFFEQFNDLMRTVPVIALAADSTNVNCDYSNALGHCKNCYLVFWADFTENSYYCDYTGYTKDSFDCLVMEKAEFCVGCFDVQKCNRAIFCASCQDSYNVVLSKNLVGCSNCFGCVNLRNKQYHIFNKPYSKEEYLKKLKEHDLGSYKGFLVAKAEAEKMWGKYPEKYMHGRNNVNVQGEHINHSKNVSRSYLLSQVEDSKYCSMLYLNPSKDCWDYTSWGNNAQLIYESQGVGENVGNISFSYTVLNSYNLQYCQWCANSKDCFGCVGLRNKQYCIFNKQYSKTDYENLASRIIEQMKEKPYLGKNGRQYRYGEFFPVELAHFAYNETQAQEYFPITRQESERSGYLWKEPEAKDYNPTFSSKDLPDHIKDAPDSVVNELIGCEHNGKCDDQYQCTKAFRIVPHELEFYRKMNLSLPRLCPNCRYAQRLRLRTPFRFWHRHCRCAGVASENSDYKNVATHFHGTTRCPNEFETSYSPERKDVVYCEQCYNTEVV